MAGQEGWAGLFKSAFDGSRNAMVLLDGQRRHVEVNGAYLAQLGYPRERLIGHPVYEIVAGGPILSPEEWAAALSRGSFTGEGDLVAADGSKVSVQFAAHMEVVTGRRLVLFVVLSTALVGGGISAATSVARLPRRPSRGASVRSWA
jgi:PAS domain S-box-containing protein